MTIVVSFALAALAMWAAAKLGVFDRLAGDEHDLWPGGEDEPFDAYLDRRECERIWSES